MRTTWSGRDAAPRGPLAVLALLALLGPGCVAPPLASPLASKRGNPSPAPAPPPAPTPIAAARCVPRIVARLTVQPFDGGKPVVEVALNGRALRMQLDTGAETSALTTGGASALGLAPGPARRQVAGLGGAAGYGMAQVARIDFAGQVIQHLDLPVIPLEQAGRLDGLIGADLLAAYQIELDSPARRLTLRRAASCPQPWPAALAWRGARPLPIVTVRLDGVAHAALIDTGTAVSAVDGTAARLTARELAADRPVGSFGAGGLAITSRLHRFALLTVGGVARPDAALRVLHLDPALGFTLLLGMDVLRDHRLWLDYAGRRAFIDPRPR